MKSTPVYTGVSPFGPEPHARRPELQNLRLAMVRVDIVGMRRSEISGELVECVVTDDGPGWDVHDTVFGV
jgi:hypothetical protein